MIEVTGCILAPRSNEGVLGIVFRCGQMGLDLHGQETICFAAQSQVSQDCGMYILPIPRGWVGWPRAFRPWLGNELNQMAHRGRVARLHSKDTLAGDEQDPEDDL